MKASYTLTCSSCGNSYYSKEAFPKHQYCKTCVLAFEAGIKEVVEWIDYRIDWKFALNPEIGGHINITTPDWQSKLKEWGL